MIQVNNLTKGAVDGDFLKKVAKIVLKGERKISKYPNIQISIVLVGQARIKELNRKYRGKNKATDVLSFKYDNNFGEVVICPQKTKELTRVLVHGILHILGFDHSKEMQDKEDYYFSKI